MPRVELACSDSLGEQPTELLHTVRRYVDIACFNDKLRNGERLADLLSISNRQDFSQRVLWFQRDALPKSLLPPYLDIGL